MGAIPNIGLYNRERQDLMKIKTINDEVILFTKEEAKTALVTYIDEELELFVTKISENKKIELQTLINFKLKQMENALVNLINERIDKITERVVELTINRVVNEEVNKRLELKIQKLKDSL